MSHSHASRKPHSTPNTRTLQHWLNILLAPQPLLRESGVLDAATKSAVRTFKQSHGIRPTNDTVDELTLAALGTDLGWRAAGGNPIEVLGNKFVDALLGPLNISKEAFFRNYATMFGLPDERALSGLSQLLSLIDHDCDVSDVRWAAYMLATVRHESTWKGSLWVPIEEGGRGAGHTYGVPVQVEGPDGVSHSNAYYGRGYVQLTWKENYVKFDRALGLGDQLVVHPGLALQPETAYQIMSLGMREGGFRGCKSSGFGGHKLRDYISGSRRDYYNARNIINGGHDKAEIIAGYALKFETILRASLV